MAAREPHAHKGDATISGKATNGREDVDGTLHLNASFRKACGWCESARRNLSFFAHRHGVFAAGWRLDLDSSDLRADARRPMRLTTRSKDVRWKFDGRFALEDSNGTVEVGLRKPGIFRSITARRRAGFDSSEYGGEGGSAHAGSEIESDFDEIKVEITIESNAAARLKQWPKLVELRKGGIEIRKGTVAAVAPPAPPTPPMTAPNTASREALPLRGRSRWRARTRRQLSVRTISVRSPTLPTFHAGGPGVVKVVSGGSVPVVIDFTINSTPSPHSAE